MLVVVGTNCTGSRKSNFIFYLSSSCVLCFLDCPLLIVPVVASNVYGTCVSTHTPYIDHISQVLLNNGFLWNCDSMNYLIYFQLIYLHFKRSILLWNASLMGLLCYFGNISFAYKSFWQVDVYYTKSHAIALIYIALFFVHFKHIGCLYNIYCTSSLIYYWGK